uniref:Uncharacterized protein n=1 Tax=Panagrolaimus superbus TaxID=310955 RepID=A0A914ZI08_9BILA
MDQPLSCIRENINQLIKNPDTAIFVQVQACIVPKYEKVPSMYTIPAEFPPSKSSSSSTSSLASTSSSKTTTTKTQK